jgi:hypothetical protein
MIPYFAALAARMPDNQRLRAHLELLMSSPTEADTDDLMIETDRMEHTPQAGE